MSRDATFPNPTTGAREPRAATEPLARYEGAVLIVIGAAQLAALVSFPPFGETIGVFLLVHGLGLAAVGALLFVMWRRRCDVSSSALGLLVGAVAGPLGPLGAGFLAFSVGRSRPVTPLVADWYERIALSTAVDPEERLCDDVGVGRTIDLGQVAPRDFSNTMRSGNLAERQTILGLIARKFHPAYLAALKIALNSPEPVVRVQAAAVAAHIAPAVHDRITALVGGPDEQDVLPRQALQDLADLDALLASGLLEASDQGRATKRLQRLEDCVLVALDRDPLVACRESDIARRAVGEDALARLLIRRGRYPDLRRQRTYRRIVTSRPSARVRRLGGIRRAGGA